jgi:hypothetical protein
MRRLILVTGVLLFVGQQINAAWGDDKSTPALSAGDLTVGQPIRHGNLAVFPLISSKPKTEDRFVTLDQGLKDGSVKIMELGAPNAAERNPAEAQTNTRPAASSGGVSGAKAGDGSAAQQAPDAADPASPDVNHLLVVNHSKKSLYLMPGEIIVGGEQDRTIAQESVINPSDKPVQIEVFCVEHGRWHGREDSETASLANGVSSAASLAGSSAFAPGAIATAGSTAKAQKGDFIGSVGNVNKAARVAVQDAKTQDKVWEKVAEVNAKSSNKSESGDFAGNYADAETVKQLEPYVTALQKPVAERAQVVGVAIAINGKLDTLDVFESTPLFRQLWPKLLKSYALDAANAEADEAAEKADDKNSKLAEKNCTIDDARRFLAEAQSAAGKETTAGDVAVVSASTEHLITFSAQDSRRSLESQGGAGGFGGGGFIGGFGGGVHGAGFAK